MIQKINIEKFGLFSDYEWSKEIGNDPKSDNFKKVNIIIGREISKSKFVVKRGKPLLKYLTQLAA